uniref:Uncharacterized protein n=1 Tax=Ciona savignyi TaxID=51511 RepID=H2YSY9_CIOSA
MILEIPGVDPNARDNAGWTPISEACNRGHVDCVRQLLKLPLAPMTSKPASSVHTSSNSMPENRSPPKLEIDLLACPEEGVTPLHDALRNGHVSVAELLLEKGGVDLLHVPDKAGKTPIDVSHNQEIVSSIIVTACSIACNQRLGSLDPATSPESTSDRVCSSEDKRREMYKKMLPPDSLMSSDSWIDACNRYVMLVRHLLHTYVTETSLVTFLCYLDTPEVDYDGASDHVTDDVNDSQSSFYEITHYSKESASDVTDAKLRRYEQDVYYVLKWPEIERNFQEHMSKLLPPDSCYLPQTFNVFQGELMDRIKSLFQ